MPISIRNIPTPIIYSELIGSAAEKGALYCPPVISDERNGNPFIDGSPFDVSEITTYGNLFKVAFFTIDNC